MTLPNVHMDQVDGALGIIPPSDGDIGAVYGPADSGALNSPVALVSREDVIAAFGAGPLVEFACYLIAKTGKAVVCVRSDVTTPGTPGVIDITGVTGTSVASFAGAAAANDEYEPWVKIVTGGTIGVDGITYQTSLDNGRTPSAETALGTATSITITGSGGVTIDFDPGTLIAGDIIRSRTTPPLEDADDVATAHAALQASGHVWSAVFPANVVTAAKLAALDAWMGTLWTKKKPRKFIASARGPAVGEDNPTWQAALAAEFAASTTLFGSMASGYCKTLSAVSSQQLRRPASWAAAAWALKLKNPRRDDLAAPILGPLPSDVRIVDANNNPGEHNEETTPGLDALRFLTLRTFEGLIGTFITRPRIFAPTGSDFVWWQYRSVINDIAAVIQLELTKRLRSPVRVHRKTGYILEQDAVDIENNVNAAVDALVAPGPDVSSHKFTVSRTDQLLSTGRLTCAERVVPLAYPDQIDVTIGFVNPARVQPV